MIPGRRSRQAVGLLLVAVSPAVAQFSPCDLDGLYVMSSSALLPDSNAQLSGTLTFTPPGTCTGSGAVFSAGQRISIRVEPDDTPDPQEMRWSAKFVPSE